MCAWQGQQYQQQQQPPWPPPQQIRSSWQDPRFASQNSFSTNSPVAPTSLNPVQAFNGPPAPSTSNWGVRFNQTQQTGYSNGNKPPLPPRPPSGLAHPSSPAPIASGPSWQASTWQNSAPQTQTGFSQDPGYGAGQQWPPGAFPTSPSFSNPQSHSISHYQPSPQSSTPPDPPPRPAAYQTQAHLDQLLWQRQQHSHQGAPHHEDHRNHLYPHQQQQLYQPQQTHQLQQSYQEQHPIADQNPLVSQAHISQDDQRPPVSPEATHVVPWNTMSQMTIPSENSRPEPGSSALGTGGPSDWEHFQASVGDLEDESPGITQIHTSNDENAISNDGYAELPADPSQTDARREPFQQASIKRTEPKSPVPSMTQVSSRERSVSPEPAINGLRRTGTIDGVIQVWNTPLDNRSARAESRKSSVSTLDRSRRGALDSIKSSPRQEIQPSEIHHEHASALRYDPPAQSEQEQPGSAKSVLSRQQSLAPPPLSTKVVEIDPYADLGPEYRASLARYATTLRKEEAAPEEEKYKVFQAFVLKETRLRSILYGAETEDADVQKPRQSQATNLEKEGVMAEVQLRPTSAPSANSSMAIRTNMSNAPRSSDDSSKLTIETNAVNNEASNVAVERDDQSEYSPGGRPRMLRKAPQRNDSHPAPRSYPKATASPSDYAPMLVNEEPYSPGNKEPVLAQQPPPRPGTAPLASLNSVASEPIRFEPPRPAYTPFRYAEGPHRGSEPSVIARPAYQAYSALRHQSADSGRLMAQGTINTTTPTQREAVASPSGNNARRQHEEAFLGLIRENSRAHPGEKPDKQPAGFADQLMPLPQPVNQQTEAINSLRKIIPKTMPTNRGPSSQIVEAKHLMALYPDVFTWIPDIVVKWNRENRVIRQKQEDERQARQEESEKNIDALFNDHEIGYSDIGQLEAEFKLAEASKKYDEDVLELESFTENVFRPVIERLKEELLQLNAQYIRAVDVLELEADSGSPYIQGTDDRASRSETMEIVLALYNKMQIRYVKTAEAHYERERRRKKLELSVLYTNGDTAAMKKLEQDFSKAERQQILREAREKDSRANKLMDTFDRAAVRGLGDNQQFVDDVVAKLQSINVLVKEKQENVAGLLQTGLHETLRSLEELLYYVATDSKCLLITSNKVDNMLNNADYDVSVAEAWVANATPEIMNTLEEDKSKEDERIKAEVDTRMGSVAKGPENALSLLRGIMKRTGDDPQHQDRVQKALEAAKLRNASKTPVQ